MARSLAERALDPVWWGEQALHFLLGGVAALPAVWGPLAPLTGACAALIVAVAREYEQRPVGSWGDLAADVAFTVAGGALIGGIVVWAELM